MTFTSFYFIIFFPILFSVYYIMPKKYRWFLLLIASLLFYINTKPIFALLVSGITLSTYVFTRLISFAKTDSMKKYYMFLSIGITLLPLFFFKYFSNINNGILHFLESISMRWPLPEINLILPVGISFYTFMAVGYTIDVYNAEIEVEKNIGILGLFLSFFPLILSGPIERANNMLLQFKTMRSFDYDIIVKGLKLILWGYFMKLVVANRIGIYVDLIMGNYSQYDGSTLLFSSLLYPFQVYADLGGYSLIAIGIAKLLGINVMDNFRQPFFATSMSQFWRRWHISLISWLTDYIYTPLNYTFRRYKIWGIVLSLLITFLISGLWHGATTPFVVWGFLQGIFLSIEVITNNKRAILENKYNLTKKLWYNVLGICLTYLLFSATLLFSKVATIKDAFNIYSTIFSSNGTPFIESSTNLIFIIIGIIILLSKDFIYEYIPNTSLSLVWNKKFIKIVVYCSITILIILFGEFGGNRFIYFQF